jgi:hypothetical protein
VKQSVSWMPYAPKWWETGKGKKDKRENEIITLKH